jgi:hypothetical protein
LRPGTNQEYLGNKKLVCRTNHDYKKGTKFGIWRQIITTEVTKCYAEQKDYMKIKF